MDWNLFEEKKKAEQEKDNYRTGCRILAVIIVIIAFLWWRSDNGRLKWINELQEEIEEKDNIIQELESTVEFWKEEAGQ